jgi:dihydropteroate synthase
MGILNVTPDSFSDGGQFASVDAAVHRAGQMLEEGAAILDIGGESTRPRGKAYGAGATTVSAAEEIKRTVPVIEAVAREFPHAILSIDTYKGEVARAALRAGAHIVNDVTGLRHGIGTARAAADFSAPLVVMHALGRPGDMPHLRAYEDVVDEVAESLAESVRAARNAGVEHVVIDPGFGFGKSVEGNLQLIAELHRFVALGRPVLVGISRKSTVGTVLGSEDDPVPVGERLFGSLGLTALAAMKGASIVRTHDVRPTVDLLKALSAAEGVALREAAK